MVDPSQSQQYMALDEKTLSTPMTGDAMQANCPQTAEPDSEYASLNHLHAIGRFLKSACQ